MKRVFIYSQYNGGYIKQITNCHAAKQYCKFACLNGISAIAPMYFSHIFSLIMIIQKKNCFCITPFPFSIHVMKYWIFADSVEDIDEYMKKQIEYAKNKNIKLRYFTTDMVERTFDDRVGDR